MLDFEICCCSMQAFLLRRHFCKANFQMMEDVIVQRRLCSGGQETAAVPVHWVHSATI